MLNYSKTIDYYEKYLKYKKKYLDLKNSNMIGGFPHFRSEAKINLLTDIELPYKIIFNIIDSFSDKNIKNTIDEIIEQKIERYSNSKSEDKQFYLSSDISATRVEPSGIITNQSKKKSGRTIEMFKETYNAEIKNVLPIYIKKLKSIMVNLDSIDNQKCDASSIKLNDMLNSKDKNLNSDFLRICSSKTEKLEKAKNDIIKLESQIKKTNDLIYSYSFTGSDEAKKGLNDYWSTNFGS